MRGGRTVLRINPTTKATVENTASKNSSPLYLTHSPIANNIGGAGSPASEKASPLGSSVIRGSSYISYLVRRSGIVLLARKKASADRRGRLKYLPLGGLEASDSSESLCQDFRRPPS